MNKTLLKWSLLLVVSTFFFSCAGSIRPGGSSNPYQEDLSKIRARYTFDEKELLIGNEPKHIEVDKKAPEPVGQPAENSAAITNQLNEIIQTINQQNRSVRYMPGYRIQLYVGNIRAEADAAKNYLYRNFPSLSPYITFSQPTYRVRVGDFMTKSEAETFLSSMKAQYNMAVVVADRIEIEKGLQQAISGR